MLSFVERIEVSSSQIVVVVDLSDSEACAGAALSLEGATLQADIGEGVLFEAVGFFSWFSA